MMRFSPFQRPRQDPTEHVPAAPGRDSALWQSLLQITEDAILMADSTGRILLSNLVATRLFATNDGAASVPGTLLTHTLSSELDEVFQDAVRRGVRVEADVALSQPVPRSLHACIMPVAEEEFLLVLRDLTELRHLERVRRDFVANVSHELRTPLTSIKAMAETLLDGARTDESVAGRFLETIIHESDRLVRLSSDLLDLSRVETRGPNKSLIDLSTLIAEVVGRFNAPAHTAGIGLSNRVLDPLMIMADHDEMAQVLVNLVDNAISYTPRGGSVTITARDEAETVIVSVADTGIGILSHDIPRLFERFYRADKARSRASGGTGLGLSIVKHIVENHGGTVGVVSEYNHGSEFTFTLPK